MSTAHEHDVTRLALEIHEQLCDRPADQCHRWAIDRSEHRAYYHDRACSIIMQLEPEIGIVNVAGAVRVILGELL
jgi:hypothetical protein